MTGSGYQSGCMKKHMYDITIYKLNGKGIFDTFTNVELEKVSGRTLELRTTEGDRLVVPVPDGKFAILSVHKDEENL